jgi:transcriptional regulator with XRE-family HTH domain
LRVKKQPKVTKKDLGYYMRVWRAERDLSQSDAARFFGMGPSHWSLMEDGKRKASPDLAIQLEAAGVADFKMLVGVV